MRTRYGRRYQSQHQQPTNQCTCATAAAISHNINNNQPTNQQHTRTTNWQHGPNIVVQKKTHYNVIVKEKIEIPNS
jgi:hypothetical protein